MVLTINITFKYTLLLRTTTHIRLGIALEAPKLEVVTLEARKLEVVTLEVVLILEEQVQLVLTRVTDNVSRLSIYTARMLLGYSKSWKVGTNFKSGKVRIITATVTSVTFREKSAPSLLLSRP